MDALLTGAGGFVGSALGRLLPDHAEVSLGAADWESRLERARFEGTTVFHLAARVHVDSGEGEGTFRRDNVEKTRRLALEAARRGARRLVFLSSIKVYGEESPGRPLRADDPPAPADAYARSKREAELELERISREAPLPVVVVRSPLVLGADAKGNLASLLALADTRWPLPFAAIANRRAFVHVEDLARLLETCGSHDAAPGRTFLVGHGSCMSTPHLLGGLRRALGRPRRLFAVAPSALEAVAAMLGQGEQMKRLTRSLECDASETSRTLGWSAARDLDSAIDEMAGAWKARSR